MRSTLLPLLLVAGCLFGSTAKDGASIGDDGSGSGSGGNAGGACAATSDCVLAATTCCECPTFATNLKDPIVRACASVVCPVGDVCPGNVEAACVANHCVLACAPTQCATEDCQAGFATDPNGCLTCACAAPGAPSGGCNMDGDCVRTRADCCGCLGGGQDTAVLATDAGKFDSTLNCPATPACPGVNTCVAGDAPRCVQGQCELLSQALPPDACGRPDLPKCSGGTVCTVNASDPGNLYGVGVCLAP